MRKLTVGELFAGIGGIGLGLERAGMEVRWHSEIDPYASRVLAKHWPRVPNHGDITQIDFAAVEPVDVLAGGFPCQDISNAGKREGIGGERSGLWSEYARAIGDLRPRYVFVENVAALLARGLERVLGELAALGYDAEWDCIPASAVGAPHQRDRLWIVAHADRDRVRQQSEWDQRKGRRIRAAERGHAVALHDGAARVVADARSLGRRRRHGEHARRGAVAGDSGQDVADTERARLEGHARHGAGGTGRQGSNGSARPAGLFGRIHASDEWATEPDVGRVANGVPARVDRLRGLGNAVVPQIPELIGGWIIEHARATGYLEEAA